MLFRSAVVIIILTAAYGNLPCRAGDLQFAENGNRIVVPRVGSMDPKVYPVEPQQYKPDCIRRERDLRPSPDTGYGTPGPPLVSPGQIIPGRLPGKSKDP